LNTTATDVPIVVAGAVRDDALGGVTPAAGDAMYLLADANGALWTHDDALDAALAGSELQVDVVAALPAGDNNIGNVDIVSGTVTAVTDITNTIDSTISGAALTALQLIDNVVLVEDAVHSTGASGVMALSVRNDTLAALAGTDGDYAPLQVNATGALFVQEGAAMDVSAATVTVDLGANNDVTVTSGSITADLGANNDVTIDGSSIVLAEDAVHSSGAAGVMALSVRNDSLAALAGTDGDYSPLQVDASGSLYVTGGGGGTEYTQDAAHADPATGATFLMARDDALSTQETTDGDWTLPRANARGAQWVELDATNAIDVSAATVTVDLGANNDVTVTSGSITADLGANNDVTIDASSIVLAEDAVHGSGDAGVMSLAVRNDTLAALAGTDGDYAPLQVNATGALFVQEGAAMDVSAATVTVDLGANNDVTIDAAAVTSLAFLDTIVYNEDVASGAADPGVAIHIVRDDALAANAGVGTDGDYMPMRANNWGAVWTAPYGANTGGCKMFNSVDLDESEEDPTSGATTIYSVYAWNATAAPLWLQMFNTNTVTVGTTAPTNNFLIPANADSDGAGVMLNIPPQGLAYSTALTVAITTGSGTNSGAPALGAAGVVIMYQD